MGLLICCDINVLTVDIQIFSIFVIQFECHTDGLICFLDNSFKFFFKDT